MISTIHTHVAVVGAGPYGLAVAARLKAAGVPFVVFGKPMSFWREHVPVGTRLLTNLTSCSFARPNSGTDCLAYEKAPGITVCKPMRAEEFTAYGLWFQQQAGLECDERLVVNISRMEPGFAIRLADDTTVKADRVVLCVGLRTFANRPPEFAGVPYGRILHTSDLRDPASLRGRSIAVIGRGQSALDAAALLFEAGCQVEVLARTGSSSWADGGSNQPVPAPLEELQFATRLRVAAAEFLRNPTVFHRLPVALRRLWLTRALMPKPSLDLVPRLAGVALTAGCAVREAAPSGSCVVVRLDDGTSRTVDHVVLGTGYRIDVEKIGLIDKMLTKAIGRRDGYPHLGPGLESTVPGLHFAGAVAAASFGPLMWFVRGAPWAAEAICQAVAKQ